MTHGEDDETDDDELNCWMIRSADDNQITPKTMVRVCGTEVALTVDTGAQVNIMDEASFKGLARAPKLEDASVGIYGYGKQSIDTVGEFTTKVKRGELTATVKFIVTRGDKGNLLSYESSVMLGIIREIKALEADYYKELRVKYSGLFTSRIGLLKDYVVKLHIDHDVKPIQQRLRPVPFNVRDKVEAELN